MTDLNIGYAAIAPNKIVPCKYGTKLMLEDGSEYPVVRKEQAIVYLGKTIDAVFVEVEE